MIKNFYYLEIWIRSRMLVKNLYVLTSIMPIEEKYGLISQIRRNAISVPSNIAERSGRKSAKGFIQFLYIAVGSLGELETQWYWVMDLGLGQENELQKYLEEFVQIRKMIYGLIKTL